MEALTQQEIKSRIVKRRLGIATSQGKLLPVFDFCGGIDHKEAMKGFRLYHVFILRWVFSPYVKDKTHKEVIEIANGFLREQVRLNEIYEALERRIAEKKILGTY